MISKKGKNLVFIFSLPRSGSTLLSAVLGNHSQVYCPPEPWILLRLAEVYGNAAENKIYDDYVAEKAVKAFLSENEFINSARAFAQASYNSLLTRTDQQIFVDKTPRYYHILDFIDTLFPKAKKIWLKRNPLDTAASYKITWNRGIDYLIGETLDPTSFDFILGLSNLQKFFAKKSPEKLEIKYEDLVHYPEPETKKIAAFCNIEFEPSMLDLSESQKGLKIVLNSEFGDKKIKDRQQFDCSSIDCWEKHLNPNEIKKFTGYIGRDIFINTGYEETVTDHPELFDLTTDKEILKKNQGKILEDFNHSQPLQMAHIYDLETYVRKYREEIKETHKKCMKLTADLNEERLRSSDLEQKNVWLQGQLQVIRQELEKKEPYTIDNDKQLINNTVDITLNDPILIFQMGKVGSSSVYQSLKNAGIPNTIFHVHQLSDKGIGEKENWLKHHNALAPHWVTEDLLYMKKIKNMVEVNRSKFQWKIITMTRDPVGVKLSAFFENIKVYGRSVFDPPDKINVEKTIDYLMCNVFNKSNVKEDYFLNWFDRELKTVFGIDVYTVPYNFAQGYSIISKENVSVLVIRIEDMKRSFQQAMSDFLNITDIKLEKDNTAEKKSYRNEYQSVLENFKLAGETFDLIYSTRYARHFYPEDEREKSRQRWVSSSRPLA